MPQLSTPLLCLNMGRLWRLPLFLKLGCCPVHRGNTSWCEQSLAHDRLFWVFDGLFAWTLWCGDECRMAKTAHVCEGAPA
jgi:hypothetical protein